MTNHPVHVRRRPRWLTTAAVAIVCAALAAVAVLDVVLAFTGGA
jgi:hypothetical protein